MEKRKQENIETLSQFKIIVCDVEKMVKSTNKKITERSRGILHAACYKIAGIIILSVR